MKQLIVLVATIVLGIVIASMVMGFKTNAKAITGSAQTQLGSIMNVYNSSASAIR
jgi:FlaG/FlaF family flagellin (archaellin)